MSISAFFYKLLNMDSRLDAKVQKIAIGLHQHTIIVINKTLGRDSIARQSLYNIAIYDSTFLNLLRIVLVNYEFND